MRGPAAIADAAAAPGDLRAVARELIACLGLVRGRVLAVVVFTAAPIVAAAGDVSPWIVAAVLAGTALVGMSCDALNAHAERVTDALMERTRRRPLPSGRLSPATALAFGAGCGVAGVLALLAAGGPLAAALGLATLAHYVGTYTLWLKRRSPQNIVIGGAAGAAAPLIAQAALEGRIGLAGFLPFLFIFTWTPAHFWAIALYRKEEYRAAGIPMLPLVVGDAATRRRQLLYAVLLVPVSLLPVVAGTAGVLYGAVAAVTGLRFALVVARAIREANTACDRRVFLESLAHLVLVFLALAADVFLGGALS